MKERFKFILKIIFLLELIILFYTLPVLLFCGATIAALKIMM
jgi:hypothetical protein